MPNPTTMKHIINLAADPKVPDGFTLISHVKGDEHWEFDASKIELFVTDKQKSSGGQIGKEVIKQVPNSLNINVLWYLLDHQELIPDEWGGKYVMFNGTVLRDPSGNRYVLGLCFFGAEWCWDYRWLNRQWDADRPSASLRTSDEKLDKMLDGCPHREKHTDRVTDNSWHKGRQEKGNIFITTWCADCGEKLNEVTCK